MKIAIYPGSFDPVTNGHLDIIERSSKIFDSVIVSVLVNPNKNSMFTIKERVELLKKVTSKFSNVKIDTFDGLLVDYLERKNANIIIKGLRAIADFEYEFQMALMNRRLNSNIETMFMMTNSKYTFLSSSLIKEVVSFNGDISGLVPEIVEKELKKKLALNEEVLSK